MSRSIMPRRVFLRRSMGAAGGLLVTAIASACGAKVSAKAATTPANGAAELPTTTAKAASPSSASAPSPTANVSTASSAAPASAAPVTASGAPFDATKEVAVAFKYVAVASIGRMPNPYVAVWIENAAGAAVRSISLNYQAGRGDRYLPDLTRWFRTAKATAAVETISSATRVPGAYKIVWDGMDDKHAPVPQGDYFVCVEAARERGPYELVREQVTIGNAPFMKSLVAKGELQDVTVELRARS